MQKYIQAWQSCFGLPNRHIGPMILILLTGKVLFVLLRGVSYEMDSATYLFFKLPYHHPPLYSLLLSLLQSLTHNVHVYVGVQLVIFCLLAGLSLSSWFRSTRARYVAACVLALDPITGFFCSNLMSECLFMAFLLPWAATLTFYLDERVERRSYAILLLSAFLCATLYATRLAAILFPPFFVVMLVWRTRKLKALLLPALLFILAFQAFLVPVKLPYLVHYDTFAVTGFTGTNLWNNSCSLYPDSSIRTDPTTEFERFLATRGTEEFATANALIGVPIEAPDAAYTQYLEMKRYRPKELITFERELAGTAKRLILERPAAFLIRFVLPSMVKPFYIDELVPISKEVETSMERAFGHSLDREVRLQQPHLVLLLRPALRGNDRPRGASFSSARRHAADRALLVLPAGAAYPGGDHAALHVGAGAADPRRAAACPAARRALARMRLGNIPAAALLAALILHPGCGEPEAPAGGSLAQLSPIPVSASTGKKPQSKLWFHGGRWWAVMPSETVVPSGSWLWRLEPDNSWKNVLLLSSNSGAKADARRVGNITHILLHDDIAELVSVEYQAAEQSYRRWAGRPRNTPIPLPDSETATIDIDSTGRIWLATESGSSVHVYYSDSPYFLFKGPVTLAEDIDDGDISLVTALPGGEVGVLWSNQNRKRFGFRVHPDGAGPTDWLPDELPASQSAIDFGGGMADDHLNVAVGSDGTLYAAVKTSYDAAGYPKIALLVRRPSGDWDDLYEVDQAGTRGIVLLNEQSGTLSLIYASQGRASDIICRESPLQPIDFGPRRTLLEGPLNNATSTRERWSDSVVILAGSQGGARGAIINRALAKKER